MRQLYRDGYYRGMARPEFAMMVRLRVRLAGVIRRKTGHKLASVIELVGCSREKLISHIESQFQNGMSWENRSDWHIDHIRPISSFNMLDLEEQRRCFHYTNLQPLWQADNLAKGCKLIAA